MKTFKIGDAVKYSSGWLQSTGLIASEYGHAKGTITDIKQVNTRIQLITVKWDMNELPSKILNTNLSKIREGVSND